MTDFKSGKSRESSRDFGRPESADYAQEVGIDWEWNAMDGAMTLAPLGGKRNWSQPNPFAASWVPSARYSLMAMGFL